MTVCCEQCGRVVDEQLRGDDWIELGPAKNNPRLLHFCNIECMRSYVQSNSDSRTRSECICGFGKYWQYKAPEQHRPDCPTLKEYKS